MSYVVVDATSIPAGHGPHPAASPFDRRISDALHVSAFEVYQVELPPGAETVPHDHLDDRNDDVYAVIAGDGWIVIDGASIAVGPGQFVSVELHHRRHLHAGPDGLTVIAVCAEQRDVTPPARGGQPKESSTPAVREPPEEAR
ncbi:cupin [Williamsia sp.]|uniref:cupin domain-containing protein n=1 Tax=Williamsia sp. TaxID=1872085 RepID=UPI0025CD0AC4|nr:cupin [Williamsia sp.]